MFDILEIFDERPPPINIIDIGAQDVGPGSMSYGKLVEAGLCRVIGFEPVREACAKLNRRHPDFTCLPYVIGDGTIQRFYLTNVPMTASLYEPNHELLSRFTGLDELCHVVRVDEVQTVRLDDVREINFSPDFIKCDVQGAELQVFENAPRLLKDTLVVESEVEFVQLYKNQPLFGEIDGCLRGYAFEFHRMLALNGRPYRPLSLNGDPNKTISQHLWSDAVYFKNFTALRNDTGDKLLKLAVLLHAVYGSFDLCCAVLRQFDMVRGTQLQKRYIARLTGPNKQVA